METIFLVTVLAILGPVIGSLIGVIRKPSDTVMFNMLSFAAGVMLAISFLQLIPQSIKLSSPLFAIAGIAIGSVVMFGLDRLIPHIHPGLCENEQGTKLKKTSFYLMLGILLHNFPEGMVMAIGTVSSVQSGIAIALAIAIQKIPEGICTSAPYYYCTKKKLESFLLSASTAIPMLLGFLAAYFLFKNIPLTVVGVIIGATAGIMIYISGDELIPASSSKMTDHSTIFSLIAGILLVVLLSAIQ